MSVGPMEVAAVLILFLLLFGARRVPEAGRALGTSLREFKQGLAQAKEPIELASKSLEPGESPQPGRGVQGADVERR
jgi:sec-independent protein translocase protein TatA